MKRLSILLAALLLLACLMSACTQAPEGPADTAANTAEDTVETAADTAAETTPSGKITYTVTVVDQNGAPVAGVSIQMCTADSCLMPAPTAEDGTVRFTLAPAAYHATVAICPEGYTAEAAAEYHFEGDATALTITVTKN